MKLVYWSHTMWQEICFRKTETIIMITFLDHSFLNNNNDIVNDNLVQIDLTFLLHVWDLYDEKSTVHAWKKCMHWSIFCPEDWTPLWQVMKTLIVPVMFCFLLKLKEFQILFGIILSIILTMFIWKNKDICWNQAMIIWCIFSGIQAFNVKKNFVKWYLLYWNINFVWEELFITIFSCKIISSKCNVSTMLWNHIIFYVLYSMHGVIFISLNLIMFSDKY